MSLHLAKNQKGFTIVELLIVIVVIGILAAITIVAFNGVQNRGKFSSAQSAANGIIKKLESWNAVQGSYPTYCQLVTNTTNPTGSTPTSGVGVGTCVAGSTAGPQEAKLESANSVTPVAASVTSANGTSVVQVAPTSATGARVSYWNYTASSPAITTSATTPASPTVGTP